MANVINQIMPADGWYAISFDNGSFNIVAPDAVPLFDELVMSRLGKLGRSSERG